MWQKTCRLRLFNVFYYISYILDNFYYVSYILDNFFSAVFVTETLQNSQNHQRFGWTLEDVLLSPVAVAGVLSKLDSPSAAGPDGLHPCLLKCCDVALSWPLYLLYVKSLDEGLLPSLWKTSIIVPLFKYGSRAILSIIGR